MLFKHSTRTIAKMHMTLNPDVPGSQNSMRSEAVTPLISVTTLEVFHVASSMDGE